MSSSRPPEAPTAKNPHRPTDQATREEPGRTRKATQETVPAEQTHAVVTDSSARYQERSVLGKGGMGRVILVYDSNLAREVAMKEREYPTCLGTPQVIECRAGKHKAGGIERPKVRMA